MCYLLLIRAHSCTVLAYSQHQLAHMADAPMVCHPLPLDRNMVFEIAHCPSTDWELGGVLPPACGWKPLTLCKAGDVVLTNNMNPVGVAFFNFGTGKPMAARKYVHIGERDGIYHFTARN